MGLNNYLFVLVIIILSVANGDDALEHMKNHRSDRPINKSDLPMNILQPECQISAELQPGNVSKFYYLSHRDGEPLTILVTPCSGPVSWTVTSVKPPEDNRQQGDETGSLSRWPVNQLIPGSSPLFSYDGDEAQNFTIPCVQAGLYRLEIKTPVDSNKMVVIPKTVNLYATSSALDHLPISYENTRGKRHRSLRFQPRRNRRRLTVSWSKSHVDPHLSTYCLAVTSGTSLHPPTLCAAKNVLVSHSHSGRGSSSKEHVHKGNPTGLHCVHQTRVTLHGLVYDTTYNFTLYVVNTRNNLSTRIAAESLKYKKTQAQVLLTGRYVTAKLQKNFGIVNFRYQPHYNESTEFHVLPCGGGVVRAKLRGPDGITRHKKEVKTHELLKAPALEKGKKYTLRISAAPQELGRELSVKVLATQAGTIEYPEVPFKEPPREFRKECNEVTIGVDPVGAAEYCILARELRGITPLKLAAIPTIPDQCDLHRRRRSEYSFDHCVNRTDPPGNKAQIFKITNLLPGKWYQVQITAQIHGQSLSYPLIKVRTKKNCPPSPR
ncbi:protein NDNF [Diachasma alloeum]|uniref:protein NDNF n=1 Tax=Diachasma alloeum TaxID=454923 RepID=UPI0007384267|nr:protein NDNF [Diachasma alloeum]